MERVERHAAERIERALTDTPVVLVAGARQVGKTTLVKGFVQSRPGTRYVNLDDAATLAAASADPRAFLLSLGERAAIDEVQHEPALFRAMKTLVDDDRRPGRFILTGSANVFLLPRLSDSLAGRMEITNLWPLSQGELEGHTEDLAAWLFGDTFSQVPKGDEAGEILRRATRGGFPEAVSRTGERRREWFDAYLTTILQRDVRDLSDIQGLSSVPRLLSLMALRAGSLLNVADLARVADIKGTTMQRYLALLEATFLVRRLPAWSSNRSKRLIKAPKVVMVDSGLLANLGGLTMERLASDPALAGSFIESFVASEIWRQLTWSQTRAELFHFRTHTGQEVDLVLEADDGRIVGIEVKFTQSISKRDLRGLAVLKEMAGPKFHRGVVLYAGTETLPFGPDMWAVPISRIWGARDS